MINISKDYIHYHIGCGKIRDVNLEKELFNYFKNASTASDPKIDKLKDIVRAVDNLDIVHYNSGLKNFKRRVLGICGSSTVKTYDELADIFIDIKAANSLDDANKITHGLMEQRVIRYSDKGLYFKSEIKDNSYAVMISMKPISINFLFNS